jgi:hypothetical protein
MSPKEYSRHRNQSTNDANLHKALGSIYALFPKLNPGIDVEEKPNYSTYSGKLKSWQQRRDLATTIRLNGGALREGVEDALAEEWELLKPHAECEAEHCPWHNTKQDNHV